MVRYTGFPSPAEQYSERRLDLNTLLIRHPAATIMMRVTGDGWQGSGIHSGDTLIIDRSLKPQEGHFVIAGIEGEFKLRRVARQCKQMVLEPGADSLDNREIQLLGVVTWVIHQPG